MSLTHLTIGAPARRRLIAVLGAAVVAAVVAAVAAAVARGGHARSLAPAHRVTGPVGLVPAGSIEFRTPSAALLAADGSLWVAGRRFVARLDPASGRVRARIAVSGIRTRGSAQLAAGDGHVWVAYPGSPTVLRIDPATDRAAAIGLGRRPAGGGVAFTGDRVWVARDRTVHSDVHGDVVAIDPRTGRLVGSPLAVGSQPARLSAGPTGVWVQNDSLPHGAIARIDTRTGAVSHLAFAGGPVVGLGAVWITPQGFAVGRPGSLRRYDPRTHRVTASIPVPRAVEAAFGAGRVWAVSFPRPLATATASFAPHSAGLWQVDPRSDRIVGRPVRLGAVPLAVAVCGHELWVALEGGRLLHFRIDP